MKPLSFVLVLLIAIDPAVAQQPGTTIPQSSSGTQQEIMPGADGKTSADQPLYEQYPNGSYYEVEYRKLRQGTDMRFEYRLFEGASTGTCINLANVPHENRQPIRLEFDAVPGLSFSSPSYPDANRAKSNLKPSPRGCTSDVTLKVTIHADEDTPVGPRSVSGRMVWQPLAIQGPRAAREVKFDIPIEIVARNEKVTRTGHFQRPSPAWWLFAPVVVVGALYCAVAEGVGVGCPFIQ